MRTYGRIDFFGINKAKRSDRTSSYNLFEHAAFGVRCLEQILGKWNHLSNLAPVRMRWRWGPTLAIVIMTSRRNPSVNADARAIESLCTGVTRRLLLDYWWCRFSSDPTSLQLSSCEEDALGVLRMNGESVALTYSVAICEMCMPARRWVFVDSQFTQRSSNAVQIHMHILNDLRSHDVVWCA